MPHADWRLFRSAVMSLPAPVAAQLRQIKHSHERVQCKCDANNLATTILPQIVVRESFCPHSAAGW